MKKLSFNKASKAPTFSWDIPTENEVPEMIMVKVTSLLGDEEVESILNNLGLSYASPEEMELPFFAISFLISPDQTFRNVLIDFENSGIEEVANNLLEYQKCLKALKGHQMLNVAVDFVG